MMPQFVSQTVFRATVLLAERRGIDPGTLLGAGPLLVHPDALRWYQERLALARMRQHFGLLDA